MDRSTVAQYGPWTCKSCDAENDVLHRCEGCGHDMTKDTHE